MSFVSPSYRTLKFKFHCHISVCSNISSQSPYMSNRVQTGSPPLTTLVSFVRSNDIIFWVNNDSSIAISRTVWFKIFIISVVLILIRPIHILLCCVVFKRSMRNQVTVNVFSTRDINRLRLILFEVSIYTMKPCPSLLLKLTLLPFKFAEVFLAHWLHIIHFNFLVFRNAHNFNI